jgi:hypothetical protein
VAYASIGFEVLIVEPQGGSLKEKEEMYNNSNKLETVTPIQLQETTDLDAKDRSAPNTVTWRTVIDLTGMTPKVPSTVEW